MIEPKIITSMLKRNYWVIQHQLEGLTHEDCLLQLPFRGNCMNWVLGHMMVSRDSMLRRIGKEPLWDEQCQKLYGADSDPIINGDDAVHLDKILQDLERSQDILIPAIEDLTQEALETVLEGRDQMLGESLTFLAWHEGYHTGQTEILRQLAGTDDKVI